MTDIITTPVVSKILTAEVAKSKMQLALTGAQQSIQLLNDAEAKLVYNEDNLETIKEFIAKCSKAWNIVDKERESLKKPSIQEGRNIEAGANLLKSEIDIVKGKAHSKYTEMCITVEKRKKEEADKKLRVDAIKLSMDTFILDYTQKIVDSKTDDDLVSIERLINLETANVKKYAEFSDEFKARTTEIRNLLKTQKDTVRKLQELEKKEKAAEEEGDDAALLKIMDKKEELAAQVDEQKVKVQEAAVNQSVNYSPAYGGASVVHPEVKARRRVWKYRVNDLEKLYKKAPHLVNLSVNSEKVDDILRNKVSEGETKGKEELQYMDGLITFYVEKTY